MYNATLQEYQDAIERITRYMLTEKKTPAYVVVPRGSSNQFSMAEADDAMLRVDVWWDAKKTMPETVRFGLATQPVTPPVIVVPTPPSKPTGVYESPRFIRNDKQETNFWCGPFMSVQLIYELYGYELAQKTLAGLESTSTGGTDHSGISYGIRQAATNIGHKVTVAWQNFSGTGWKAVGEMVADPNCGLGVHCLYRNKWGHYMVPVYVDMNRSAVGFIDSLNDDQEIVEVSFAEAESWIANTPGGQPSLCLVWKND